MGITQVCVQRKSFTVRVRNGVYVQLVMNLGLYSETCLKRNMGITEACLERKYFTVPVRNGVYMQLVMNLGL